MNDHLNRELQKRIDAATPLAAPPYAEVVRRHRRARLRTTVIAAAASVAVVGGAAVGGWALTSADPDARPSGERTTPTGTSTTEPAPIPTTPPEFTGGILRSGLVVRLPGEDVPLPANDSCWTNTPSKSDVDCLRAQMILNNDVGPDLGAHDQIQFWFERPGWTFDATFRPQGEGCPTATTVEAVATGERRFSLTPAGGPAGTYQVDLYGTGPEGSVSSRFVWTTTEAGPYASASAKVGFYPRSRGEGSYALEVAVDDLAFHPTVEDFEGLAKVKITAADGTETGLGVPLIEQSLPCGQRGNSGSFYYQGEWRTGLEDLGPAPYTLDVSFRVGGTTYEGSATWKRRGTYLDLDVIPPLPGME